MKTKIDVSYGIIPIRKTEQKTEVLLIHQYSHIKNNVYWTFPKGHVEGDESPQETAKRELYEETGLQVHEFLSEQVFTTEYTFTWEGMLVNKTAAFFVATIQEGETNHQEAEVKDSEWLPLDQVIDKLDYKASHDMFREVMLFLKESSKK